MMAKIWCPYSGSWLHRDEDAVSKDHIVPLSCGGHDSFTVYVNAKKNAELGTALDGKIASHPLISEARRYYGLAGHSKKRPPVRWPVRLQGVKGEVDLSQDIARFITYRSKSEYGLNLSKAILREQQLEAEFRFDKNLILSFGCKLALGSAYFLFGEAFISYGYHKELRKLMYAQDSVRDLKFMLANNTEKGFWALNWPHSLNTREIFPSFFEALCRREDRHLIFTLHTVSELVVCISLFAGFLRWHFNIAKDVTKFPVGENFELGAVLEIDLKRRTFNRTDLRSYLVSFKRSLNHVAQETFPAWKSKGNS